MEILLEAGVRFEVSSSHSYHSPVAAAAMLGDVQIARMLLEHSAEVNAPSKGDTALDFAMRQNRPDYVRLPLEYGADPNYVYIDPCTPLGIGRKEGYESVVES